MPVETRNRVVCSGCAVLCDDIALDMQFDAVQKVHNACLRGNEKIAFSRSQERLGAVQVKEAGGSRVVDLDQGIQAVRDILHVAKSPVILGLSKVSNEAQDLAFVLARKYNATVAIPELHVHEAMSKAIMNHGITLFSLGEAINNADMLIFWGTNPIDLAPKLVVKSVFSRGRYRATGKEIKKFVVIDEYQTPTMERADIRIAVPDGDHASILASIIDGASKNGIITEPEREASLNTLSRGNGISLSQEKKSLVQDLVKSITLSEYIVLFLGENILDMTFLGNNPGFLGVLLDLARRINGRARMGIIPLSYRYNQVGLYKAMRASGHGNVADLDEVVDRLGTHDLVLSFGSDPVSRISPDAIKQLASTKTKIVAIDYKQTPTTELASIVFPATITGIDSGGTVTRFDGTSLVLNPSIKPKKTHVSDEEFLKRLLDA